MKDNINEALKEQFKPEFLNRIDDIIIFRKLSKEEAGKICRKIIDGLSERLKDRNISLNYRNLRPPRRPKRTQSLTSF